MSAMHVIQREQPLYLQKQWKEKLELPSYRIQHTNTSDRIKPLREVYPSSFGGLGGGKPYPPFKKDDFRFQITPFLVASVSEKNERSWKKLPLLAIVAIAITAIALSILVHPAVGIAFVAIEGAALYTGSKAITGCVITTLTLLISTISLSVLFPPATLITAPLTLLAAMVTVVFTTTLLIVSRSQKQP